MKLHKINDLSNKNVISLLHEELGKITDSEYIENYHPDFSNKPSNLFFILADKNGRYKKGCYYVLENSGEFICSAGWNEYEFDSSIALALTRAYVNPKFRAQYYMGQYILPEIIKSTENYCHLYITSNSYNSSIYRWFSRAAEGKSTTIHKQWPDVYKKFVPVGIKNIYFTEQFVVEYKK